MLNLDAKYAERGKSLRRFNKGDMDAWMAEFADNAVYIIGTVVTA
jgi:hypothetical protein